MKINWFTVIAQVINFLILVWLMKRYLYKPILDAIDQREKKIVSQLEDAEKKKTEAKQEQDDYRQKNETFEQQRKELMNKAVAETERERLRLLEEARTEANTARTRMENALRETQENMNREITNKLQQEVFAITRKALTDIASASLEEQSVNVFIKRLHELKEEDKKQFISSFKSVANAVLIRSAFSLSQQQQDEIQKTVNEILGTDTQFQFKTVPELISGIELTSNGYKLAWSISEYLNSLQKNNSEVVGTGLAGK